MSDEIEEYRKKILANKEAKNPQPWLDVYYAFIPYAPGIPRKIETGQYWVDLGINMDNLIMKKPHYLGWSAKPRLNYCGNPIEGDYVCERGKLWQ